LAENLAIEHAAKTLTHETAHVELRHIDDVNEYRRTSGGIGVQAEFVALILAGLSGFHFDWGPFMPETRNGERMRGEARVERRRQGRRNRGGKQRKVGEN